MGRCAENVVMVIRDDDVEDCDDSDRRKKDLQVLLVEDDRRLSLLPLRRLTLSRGLQLRLALVGRLRAFADNCLPSLEQCTERRSHCSLCSSPFRQTHQPWAH